jgi:hypothetical protein
MPINKSQVSLTFGCVLFGFLGLFENSQKYQLKPESIYIIWLQIFINSLQHFIK